MEETGPSLVSKAVAALVLLVAAWLLIKVVIGAVMAVAWTAVGILALLAVVWAYLTLRS